MKYLSLLCLALISTSVQALTPAPADILVLTLINHSGHTLHYKNIAGSRTGNIFTLSTREILPGASTTIEASSTPWTGISGSLIFEDTNGNRNVLEIRDPLQIGIMQHPAKFSMDNTRLVSFVPSLTLNGDSNPGRLAWTSATIEVENRVGLV